MAMKCTNCHFHRLFLVLLLALIFVNTTTSFSLQQRRSLLTPSSSYGHLISELSAKKSSSNKNKKKKATGGAAGGGFGAGLSLSPPSTTPTISADKNSLEKQWDIFTSITDLEIKPKGTPEDEDYVEFQVVDVFVKCDATTETNGTGWFRIGKVCTLPEQTSIDVALKLQKGLIFWTAVHMRRELVAVGGKSGAAALQLGYTKEPTMIMGTESDPPIYDEETDNEDDDEEEDDNYNKIELVTASKKASFKNIPAKTFGFRPDWNPQGFTYKRREKAAMKKKKSSLEEMKEVTSGTEE